MSADLAILWRLLGLARPYWRWMALAGVVATITVLASVGLMMTAGWFIATAAIFGLANQLPNYFLPSPGIRLFAILRTGGRYGERLLSHEATFRLLAGMRLWLFRRLEPLAPTDLMDRRGADLATGLQADIDTLQHAYLRLAAPVAVAVACGVFVVAVLAAFHPPSAVVVGALLVCAGGVGPALARRAAARPGAESVRLRAELRVAVADALQGATDLRAAGAEARQRAAVAAISSDLVAAQRQAAAIGALAEAGVGLCSGLALWGAALLGSASVVASQLSPALVPGLALGALASFEAVAPLPAAMQRWGEVMAAARRIFTLADRQPTVVAGDAPSPEPLDAGIVFRDVRLAYGPDAAPALDGLSLEVPAGTRLAVLGPSGAGKSSIARLLLRFWNYEGDIRLGGHDLRAYRPEDARRLVGVASQDGQLFNGTVRDNLRMAAPGADEGDMLRCLAEAQLAAFVAALPAGLDTWIGEGGARLSAGQARRLVVARTLLRDPAVLVLDEPTENLDPTTARRLLRSIAEARTGRTMILITHDPVAAAEFAERTVRLEAGRLVS